MAKDYFKLTVKSKIRNGDYTGAMHMLIDNGYSVMEASKYITELQEQVEQERD